MVLPVNVRLRSAADFHYAEYPGVPLSISKLCVDAGVNRANAYARHSELLKELIRSNIREGEVEDHKKDISCKVRLNQLIEKNKKLNREYKALLNLCIEQMAEIRSLRIKIADMKNK